MNPILYDADRTSFSAGSDNGLGVLSDALSCKVTQELNGQYELEMRYPVDGLHYGEIALRSILRASADPSGDLQPFRVYRITPAMGGVATIYARHIVYDLSGYVVSPFTASNAPAALAALKSHALPADMPFSFSTDKTTAATMAVTVPTSLWSLLGGQQGSVLDVYGGEYEFAGWTVRLLTRRGADRGVSVRYGKNLTDLTQDSNCESCYTGVVPYWTSMDATVTAAPVYAEGQYGYVRLMPLDLSQDFAEQPAEPQLQAAAAAYIKSNQIGVPRVSWDIKLALLSQASGYEDVAFLEQIYLGDTVGVRFQRMGVDAKARVNAIVWDCLLERYDSVALGSVKASIAATVADQQREIDEKPSVSMVERISGNLAAAMMGARGGSVRLLDTNNDGEPDTLYIADDADPVKAKKVWRFNYEGWAASSTGYSGPFKLGATVDGGLMAWMVTAANLVAGTIDAETVVISNLSADSITSGTLDAARIDADNLQVRAANITGTLTTVLIRSQDGKSSWDLASGAIDLYNTRISTSATGATYTSADYTQEDVVRAQQITAKAVSPTLADYEKLDVNGDGIISITDTVQLQQIVNGTRSVNFTTRWQLRIDPSDGDSLLKISRVYHDNTTGVDTEYVVFSVGFANARANSLEAFNVAADEEVSAATVSADSGKFGSLTVNGAAYQPFQRKVIGYAVFCTGGSGNQAGCFIPAGISGTFQCASNDWYCSFRFDGSGTATKTGGTGSVSSVSALYNS